MRFVWNILNIAARPDLDTASDPLVALVPRDTIARRFFRRAFGIFIAFAVLLTLILVVETLWTARDNLKNELAIYQRTFEKSLASALWSMDREKLESIAKGIVEIPDINGVRITDPLTGTVLVESGVIPGEAERKNHPLVHRFDVIHDEGYGKERVAAAEFYSSFAQLLRRTQGQIILIIILATLKTLAFWWIFLFVGQRLLGRPLTEITHAISSSDSPRRLQLSPATEQAIANTELALLRQAYDDIASRMLVAQRDLEQANADLDRRVQERTLELQDANHQLDMLAHTDYMTGLANRRQFIAVAEVEIARARRSARPLSLIVCDIDNFKQVNDTHGHLAGDKAITHVAQCLLDTVRQVDVAGRFGGDEFVILLPDVGLDEAGVVAERLRESIADTPLILEDSTPVGITLSIGLAALADNDVSLDELFLRADAGLYAAKSSGRNCVVVRHRVTA